VTKKTQKYANAGIRVKDEQGNLLPIYFRKSRPLAIAKPVAVAQPREDLFPPRKCNDKFIFDATKSYDPGNKKLTYYWDFGDGTTSSEPVVTHVYDKVGEYTVKLLVRNDSGLECDNSQTSQVIKVNSAPRVFVTRPQKICPGQQVTFDASASKDNTPDALTYHWDFGDGTTAEGTRVTKVYKDSGSYRINLTVDDNQGTPCSSVTKGMIIDVSAPPLADAGKDVEACLANNQEYKVTFYAGRPKNIDTSNWTYRWDFGDGTTGEGRTVSHIYQRGGTYNVQLVVDDGLSSPCSSSRDTATVTLSRQPVAHAGEDILTDVGSEVSFDGSGSYCENNCNLEHTWDFGDGSVKAHGARVAHTYKKGGKYTALLTVDDGRGKSCSSATDSLIVNVNSRPTAELEKVGRPCVNTEVDFDASASRDPDGNQLKYTWDFGDGTVIEDGPRVRHVYKKDGEYIISVTVDDQVGTEASKNTRSIKIRVNTPPVANAGPNLVCCVNKRNIFDGSASSDANGDDLTYTWDFGDGVTATGKTVSHIYTKQGRYTVILTVNDNSQTACDTATDSFVALVSDKPVSVMDIRK
jgi:PKD repeat protein